MVPYQAQFNKIQRPKFLGIKTLVLHTVDPNIQSIPSLHPYVGQGQVQIGNGSILQIKNYGDGNLFSNSQNF